MGVGRKEVGDSTQLAGIGPEGKNVLKELQALRQAASEPAEWRQQQLMPPRWRVVQALGEGSPPPGQVLGRGARLGTRGDGGHTHVRDRCSTRGRGDGDAGTGGHQGVATQRQGRRAPGAAATLRRSQEHSCWHSEVGRQAISKEIGGMRWMKGRVLSSKEGSDPNLSQ